MEIYKERAQIIKSSIFCNSVRASSASTIYQIFIFPEKMSAYYCIEIQFVLYIIMFPRGPFKSIEPYFFRKLTTRSVSQK